ncbi:MAG TPA: hypothetical protein VIM55_19615 [Mucilaginibacter sp.]
MDEQLLEGALSELEAIVRDDEEIFNAISTESEVDELNRRYGKSRSHIVFISRPVETYDNSRATKFLDAIVNSLFTFDSGTVEVTEDEIVYEFHFAHRLIAYEFFDKLRWHAVKKAEGIVKEEEIQRLFASKIDLLLKVFEVDELFVTLPCALFNATSQDASGFVFFSHDSIRFSIAKMTDAAINRWYKNLYLRAKFMRKQIKFENYVKMMGELRSGQEIDAQLLLPLRLEN